jgi:hypothetical protein
MKIEREWVNEEPEIEMRLSAMSHVCGLLVLLILCSSALHRPELSLSLYHLAGSGTISLHPGTSLLHIAALYKMWAGPRPGTSSFKLCRLT